MKITDIGEVREDGSILLYDENIDRRQGLPRRIRPSAVQKQQLLECGLQWVLSSFISGVGTDGEDLLIRFWNGSLYKYYGFAKHLEGMIRAPSKGRYFWRYIRGTKNYEKTTTLPLSNDLKMDDTELFKSMKAQVNAVVMEMARKGVTEIVFDDDSGREFLKISYNGETVFLLITKKPN